MSASEHIVIDLQRRIESTLDALRRLRPAGHLPHQSHSSPAEHGAAVSVQLPRMQVPAAQPQPDELARRDMQIAKELLHLQRTLSRQTFRGAESARRLVRRLIRRAELNARELETLSVPAPSAREGKGVERDELPMLLARLSSQLTELKVHSRAAVASAPAAGRPTSDSAR
jgi:hypothetical protein